VTPPNGQKEAFSRVVIDAQLKDVGWDLTDGHSVRYEYQLPDGTFADYVLCDRHGRAAAVIEAKRASVNLQEAAAQGRAYVEQLHDVPYVFLANGDEILFWDYRTEAYPRKVASFFSQVDLERRYAKRQVRVDPLTKPVDPGIACLDYERDCINTLCRETNAGRRELLVEMATGTGKTRTEAAAQQLIWLRPHSVGYRTEAWKTRRTAGFRFGGRQESTRSRQNATHQPDRQDFLTRNCGWSPSCFFARLAAFFSLAVWTGCFFFSLCDRCSWLDITRAPASWMGTRSQ
jgi:hypothetical protein